MKCVVLCMLEEVVGRWVEDVALSLYIYSYHADCIATIQDLWYNLYFALIPRYTLFAV